jgi:hypothetical protein
LWSLFSLEEIQAPESDSQGGLNKVTAKKKVASYFMLSQAASLILAESRSPLSHHGVFPRTPFTFQSPSAQGANSLLCPAQDSFHQDAFQVGAFQLLERQR